MVTVSVTTHGPRIPFLPQFLRNLERQEILPQPLILFVDERDYVEAKSAIAKALPLNFEVDLRVCKETFGAGNKFFHLIGSNRPVVILDDDQLYPPDTISRLVLSKGDDEHLILANRVRRVRFSILGRAKKYERWDSNYVGTENRSMNLVPLGMGGVFLPAAFMQRAHPPEEAIPLLRSNDDLVIWFEARKLGIQVQKTEGKYLDRSIPGSQVVSLYNQNRHGGNDAAIATLQELYGTLRRG